MDWFEVLGDINYWGVAAATVSTFVVGMIWYSPQVFGKPWMKEVGLKEKDMNDKDAMMRSMFHSGVSSFIAGAVLASLMFATGTDGALDGAGFGGVVGFGIAMSAMVTHDVWSKRSMMLTRINGLHDIVKFVVMGALIGGIGF